MHSGIKGETWTGAVENLKKNWVSLWIKPNSNADTGNKFLIQKGGLPCAEKADKINFNELIKVDTKSVVIDDLFAQSKTEKLISEKSTVSNKNSVTTRDKFISKTNKKRNILCLKSIKN